MRHFNYVADQVFSFIRNQSTLLAIIIGVLSPWGATNLLPSEFILIPVGLIIVLHRLFSGKWTFAMHASKPLNWLLIAVTVSCVGYALSDVVRGTAIADMVKGQARFWVLYLDLLCLLALVECSWKNLPILVGVNAFFSCIVVMIYGPEGGKTDDFDQLWRWGYALPVSYLVGVVVCFVKRPIGAAIVLLLGLLHLGLENRAYGGACVLSAALLYAPSLPQRFRKTSAIIAIAGGFGILAIAYNYFKIGESSRSEESNVNRAAMMNAGWNVFLDNPAIGQGSTLPYLEMKNEAFLNYYTAKRADIKGDARAYADDTTETILHSQILTGLASGGFLGGAFFFFVGFLGVRSAWFCAMVEFPYRILVLLMLFRCAFELIAGPVLTVTRFEIPILVAPLIVLWAVRSKPKPKPAARAAA